MNTSLLIVGLHVLKLVAIDRAGNMIEYMIMFYVDNTPPIAIITYPSNNSLVSNSLNISFTYMDDNLEIAYLLFDNMTVNVTGKYNYTLDTTLYPDGELNITLWVRDKAGNTIEYTITIIIDNTAPIIDVIQPYGYVSGIVDVEWSIIEPHLDIILLYINDIEYNVTNLDKYRLDTTMFATSKPTTIATMAPVTRS